MSSIAEEQKNLARAILIFLAVFQASLVSILLVFRQGAASLVAQATSLQFFPSDR